LLTDAQTQKPVDCGGSPTDKLVFDYELSRLDPEPGIPGSTIETPIEALRANPDGTFTVSDLRYQSKLLELYGTLSKQFLTDKKTTAPLIRAGGRPRLDPGRRSRAALGLGPVHGSLQAMGRCGTLRSSDSD
jgi:hypothetical protein